jgi:UMF1 family MFS transporter
LHFYVVQLYILAPHRKQLLLVFAGLGSCAATLFLALPSSSSIWLLSALLAICANVGFGASVVAMNAYLPALARESPEVVEIRTELENFAQELPPSDIHDPDRPLLPEATSLTPKYNIALSEATSRISARGIALGYGAGILMLIIALVPVKLLHGSTFSLRLAIGLSGIWWAFFSVPAAIWLPSGSRNTENVIAREVRTEGDWNVWIEVKAAWLRLGGMLRWREVKRLRNTFKYLVAWFLLSDGTLSSYFFPRFSH